MLRRRQRIEPLPDFAHDAVARLLNEPSLWMPEELAATEEPAVAVAAAPRPAAAAGKAVVLPSGDPASADLPSSALAASNDDAAIDMDIDSDARAVPPRRASKQRRALWLGVAILVLFIAWLYGRPAKTPAAASAATGNANLAAAQAPPPAAAVDPGSTIQDCPTCPKMTVLPTRRFKQGAAPGDRDALPAEKPQHIVLIRQPLAISTTQLTVGNFREFVTATKRELAGCEVYDGDWHHKVAANWLEPGFIQNSDHPVTCVSWNDAVAYAAWLSAKTGHHYRLPSSSEWEYAARAGVDAPLPWSPAMQAACEYANVADRSAARRYPKWSVFACKDGYVNTAPVGSFKANAFGIDDMLGNVLEWTEDCWHEDYSKAPVDGSARMDGDCAEHELRGGSWFSSPAFVRLSYRNHSASGYRSSSVGVRLVRDLNR